MSIAELVWRQKTIQKPVPVHSKSHKTLYKKIGRYPLSEMSTLDEQVLDVFFVARYSKTKKYTKYPQICVDCDLSPPPLLHTIYFKVRALICKRMRVHTADGRIFDGLFECLDFQQNVLLTRCSEISPKKDKPGLLLHLPSPLLSIPANKNQKKNSTQ